MNYLLIGFELTLLKKIKEDIELNYENKAYLLPYNLNKSLYEGTLGVYKIDKVIVQDFEYFKITNSSVDIRYLENYRFLIDICARNDIKHLHIIENASKIYKGFIKSSRDYKYKEDDDLYSNDLESLNHLFIRKYAEHISSTKTLNITISRYNNLYPNFFTNSFINSVKNNEEIDYTEDNITSSYTDIDVASSSICKLLDTNEFEIYNLPNTFIGTKTNFLNNLCIKNIIEKPKMIIKQLKNMPDSYVLDDSKIIDLLKKTSN